MTEINDYLKLLWPRIAKAFCPTCGREIRPETAKSIADEIYKLLSKHPHLNPLPEGEEGALAPGEGKGVGLGEEGAKRQVREETPTVLIPFWVSVPPKTEPRKFFEFLQQQGYLRVWIDNEVVRVDANPKKIKRLGARVQVIQDRIAITQENRARLVEALETALRFGKGKVNIIPISSDAHPSILNPHPF